MGGAKNVIEVTIGIRRVSLVATRNRRSSNGFPTAKIAVAENRGVGGRRLADGLLFTLHGRSLGGRDATDEQQFRRYESTGKERRRQEEFRWT